MTAPNPRYGRLINEVSFGLSSDDEDRRGVSATMIDDEAGETCADFATHPFVTEAVEDGCTNMLWFCPQGQFPSERKRYQPDNVVGSAVYSQYHADARLRALGIVDDGGATPEWLTDGYYECCAALTATQNADTGRRLWWVGYWGRLMQPTTQPTNAEPHNWPLDLSEEVSDNLDNWELMWEEALVAGCAGAVVDVSGMCRSTDMPRYLQDVLETPGTHTGASLGIPDVIGSFTNDHERTMYVEAVADLPVCSWASSWMAAYWLVEAALGDPAERQIDDCAYPPIARCVRIAPADEQGSTELNVRFLYQKALYLLQTYPGLLVSVRYSQMKAYGLDMGALIAAGADDDDGGGDGGDAGSDPDAPFFRPRRLPSVPPRLRRPGLMPTIGP